MNKALNFLVKYWLQELSIALIAALIIDFIFRGPVKKFFVSIYKMIRWLLAIRNFEQKYRDWLIEKYKFLNVRGIKTNAPVSIELEKIFILLRTKLPTGRMSTSTVESKIEESIDKELKTKEFNRQEPQERKRGKYEAEKAYELKHLFNLPQKKFIITGSPGSGKTTLLHYLALTFAKKEDIKQLIGIEDELLPISMNLRDIISEGFLNIKNFSENYENYIKFPNYPNGFFERKLEEGACVILLDGLDEVTNLQQRINVAKWIDELATIYSKNIFIVTSRPYGYETVYFSNDFLELHIQDLTFVQVEEFIRWWTEAVEINDKGIKNQSILKEAKKKADDLLKTIKRNPEIETLTVNPLLLTIVSLVHREKPPLPKRKVELYDRCCDVILGRWDEAKRIAIELQPAQKIAILQPIAFRLHRKELEEGKREKIIELLENELPKPNIKVSREKANDLLDDLRDRCGILVERKSGFFGFIHHTLQEFLTARYILDNDLEDFLVTRITDKDWFDVIVLYCGMKDSTNFLQKILQKNNGSSYNNLFFVAKCLAESFTVSPELRTEIIQELFDIDCSVNYNTIYVEKALEILREVDDLQIVQKLIEKIKDERDETRIIAAKALVKIQAKEAIPHLIELLKDKKSNISRCASDILIKTHPKEAILPLIELLKDIESPVKCRAAYILGKMQVKEAIPYLIELLKDEDSYVRRTVVDVLGEIHANEAVPYLIELLMDEDIDVEKSASEALGKIQDKQAIYHLIQLLINKEGYLRKSATDILGKMQAKEAVPYLIELLKDKESYVRLHAIDALVKILHIDAFPYLIQLLKDRDWTIRQHAEDTLVRIQANEAIPYLIKLLKDKNSIITVIEIDILGKMQVKEAIPYLIKLLKDEASYIRQAAAQALGKIQAKEAVPNLIELLQDEQRYVRRYAAESLGKIKAIESISPLIDLLKNKESYVRESAIYALGEIQAKEAIPYLNVLLKDKIREVRESSALALSKIHEKNKKS